MANVYLRYECYVPEEPARIDWDLLEKEYVQFSELLEKPLEKTLDDVCDKSTSSMSIMSFTPTPFYDRCICENILKFVSSDLCECYGSVCVTVFRRSIFLCKSMIEYFDMTWKELNGGDDDNDGRVLIKNNDRFDVKMKNDVLLSVRVTIIGTTKGLFCREADHSIVIFDKCDVGSFLSNIAFALPNCKVIDLK